MPAILIRLLAIIATSWRWIRSFCIWLMGMKEVGSLVSATASVGFFVAIALMIDKAIVALNAATSKASDSLSGLSGVYDNVGSSFLSKVNYFFPIDTLFSVAALYVSVWGGVQVFRNLRVFITFAFQRSKQAPGNK